MIMNYLQQNITEIFICLFMGFTFLQSGIDKVTDWNGNMSFISNHFRKSPLRGHIPLLLVIILVLEIISGVLILTGTFHLATAGIKKYSLLGLELGSLTLLFLLIGQRLAKDYAGAMTLIVYFIPTIFGIYLLNN